MSAREPLPADLLVGRNIRAYRLHKGWSQSELGRQIGVTFQQIQKYEKGRNRVGASRLARIAEVLGVTLMELFEGAATAKGPDHQSAQTLLDQPHSLRLLQNFDMIRGEGVKSAILSLVEDIAGKK